MSKYKRKLGILIIVGCYYYENYFFDDEYRILESSNVYDHLVVINRKYIYNRLPVYYEAKISASQIPSEKVPMYEDSNGNSKLVVFGT